MPGDYPAIYKIYKIMWLGALLLVRGTTLNGPFIGGGVPRKAIPYIGLLFPILRMFSSGFGHLIICLYPQFWGIGR